jgi:hypothetical protein
VRTVSAVIDPSGTGLQALNRTLRGKGRDVTRPLSPLGVGVASLLIWLVLVLLFSLGVAGKAGGAETGSVQIKATRGAIGPMARRWQ